MDRRYYLLALILGYVAMPAAAVLILRALRLI